MAESSLGGSEGRRNAEGDRAAEAGSMQRGCDSQEEAAAAEK